MEYVTLFSNSSDDYFKNSPTNFKVKLPKKLKFDEEYKVGVCEIHYSKTWYNIDRDEEIDVKFFRWNIIQTRKCIFPKGYYDIDKLCKGINAVIYANTLVYDFKKFPIVKYDKELDRIYITGGLDANRAIYPIFSDNLFEILGIDKKEYLKKSNQKLDFYKRETDFVRNSIGGKEGESPDWNPQIPEDFTYHSPRAYNLSGGYHSLYLYTDIIKPTFVGDSFTQMLKVIEIPPNINFGKQVSLKYPNIQFFPVQMNEIDAIEIKMTDDTGELIDFQGDSLTIVKLCFKKVNNSINNEEKLTN